MKKKRCDKLKMPKRETSNQVIKRVLGKLMRSKKRMNVLSQMTFLMCKLNDKERIALMHYHKVVEDNARWEVLNRCFDEMVLVMKPKEFRAFEKKIRLRYGFWKVKKKRKAKSK